VNAAPSLDDPTAARTAGAQWLSVALIDARNRTLRWLQHFESLGRLHGAGPAAEHAQPCAGALPLPAQLIGRAAWFQEYWVARHVQRLRGAAADPQGPRLASIEPQADRWFARLGPQPDPVSGPSRGTPEPLPDGAALRPYLAATLETTLELLAGTPDTDTGLHVFRLALAHEDRLAERLAALGDTIGVAAPPPEVGLGVPAPSRTPREPLWIPARRFRPGIPRGTPGLVPALEQAGEEEAVPEFEIDAQAVSWARFAPFAEEGGYDDPRWWTEDGWAWVQRFGRRAPRGVEQLRGGVVLARFGRLVRAPAGEAVAHVNVHEAQAWCCWAGRRLPLEVEWELAASTAVSRGFLWGDVREWVAGRAAAWPGAPCQPVAGCPLPAAAAGRRVLRGASSWTSPRDRQRTARVGVHGARDDLFCGFRSCSA
jgi:formylglycine-generating enzyme required for sulfatase activity